LTTLLLSDPACADPIEVFQNQQYDLLRTRFAYALRHNKLVLKVDQKDLDALLEYIHQAFQESFSPLEFVVFFDKFLERKFTDSVRTILYNYALNECKSLIDLLCLLNECCSIGVDNFNSEIVSFAANIPVLKLPLPSVKILTESEFKKRTKNFKTNKKNYLNKYKTYLQQLISANFLKRTVPTPVTFERLEYIPPPPPICPEPAPIQVPKFIPDPFEDEIVPFISSHQSSHFCTVCKSDPCRCCSISSHQMMKLPAQVAETLEAFKTVTTEASLAINQSSSKIDCLTLSADQTLKNTDVLIDTIDSAVTEIKNEFSDACYGINNLTNKLNSFLKFTDTQPEDLSRLANVIKNVKEHKVGLIACITSMCLSPSWSTTSIELVKICSLIGIEKQVFDSISDLIYNKFLTKTKRPPPDVSRHESLDNTTKLALGLAAMLGHTITPSSILTKLMFSSVHAQKEMKALEELKSLIINVLEEWGLISTDKTKLINDMKDELKDALENYPKYLEVFTVKGSEFCNDELFNKFMLDFKNVANLTQKIGTKVYSEFASTSFAAEILSLNTNYIRLKTRIDSIRSCNGTRPETICYLFTAEKSGIGKTMLVNTLHVLLCNKVESMRNSMGDLPEEYEFLDGIDDWGIWNQNTDDKYHQGCTGQEIHIVDDALNLSDQSDHNDIIHFCTNAAFPTKQAELSEKGLPYKARLLFMSSNSLPLTSKSINNIHALHRRIVRVEVIPKTGPQGCSLVPNNPGEIDTDFDKFLEFTMEPATSWAQRTQKLQNKTARQNLQPPPKVTVNDLIEDIIEKMKIKNSFYLSDLALKDKINLRRMARLEKNKSKPIVPTHINKPPTKAQKLLQDTIINVETQVRKVKNFRKPKPQFPDTMTYSKQPHISSSEDSEDDDTPVFVSSGTKRKTFEQIVQDAAADPKTLLHKLNKPKIGKPTTSTSEHSNPLFNKVNSDQLVALPSISKHESDDLIVNLPPEVDPLPNIEEEWSDKESSHSDDSDYSSAREHGKISFESLCPLPRLPDDPLRPPIVHTITYSEFKNIVPDTKIFYIGKDIDEWKTDPAMAHLWRYTIFDNNAYLYIHMHSKHPSTKFDLYQLAKHLPKCSTDKVFSSQHANIESTIVNLVDREGEMIHNGDYYRILNDETSHWNSIKDKAFDFKNYVKLTAQNIKDAIHPLAWAQNLLYYLDKAHEIYFRPVVSLTEFFCKLIGVNLYGFCFHVIMGIFVYLQTWLLFFLALGLYFIGKEAISALLRKAGLSRCDKHRSMIEKYINVDTEFDMSDETVREIVSKPFDDWSQDDVDAIHLSYINQDWDSSPIQLMFDCCQIRMHYLNCNACYMSKLYMSGVGGKLLNRLTETRLKDLQSQSKTDQIIGLSDYFLMSLALADRLKRLDLQEIGLSEDEAVKLSLKELKSRLPTWRFQHIRINELESQTENTTKSSIHALKATLEIDKGGDSGTNGNARGHDFDDPPPSRKKGHLVKHSKHQDDSIPVDKLPFPNTNFNKPKTATQEYATPDTHTPKDKRNNTPKFEAVEEPPVVTKLSDFLNFAQVSNHQSCDEGARSLMELVAKQTVKVMTNTGTVHGIGTGHEIIFPSHVLFNAYWIKFCKRNMLTDPSTGASIPGDWGDWHDIMLVKRHSDPHVDLAIAEFTGVNAFKNLINHIPDVADLKHVSANGNVMQLLPTGTCNKLVLGKATLLTEETLEMYPTPFLDSLGPQKPDDLGLVKFTARQVIRVTAYSTAGIPSSNGDCGGAVISMSPNLQKKLIGFHVAGAISRSHATKLTTNIIKDCKEHGDFLRFEPTLIPHSTFQCVSSHQYSSAFPIKYTDYPVYDPIDPQRTFTPPGEFSYVGELGDRYSPSSGVTSLRPHLLYKAFPIKFMPAALNANQVKDTSYLIKNNFDKYDITTTAAAKYGTPVAPLDDKAKEFLDYAKVELTNYVYNILKDQNLALMTDTEILNGTLDGTDNMGLDLRTSPGIPWSKTCTKKKQYFNIDRETKTTNWKDESKCIPLWNAILSKEWHAKRGERVLSLWKNCDKDETRPIEKVDIGKTRLFTSVPFETHYLFSKYYGRFKQEWSNARSSLFHGVGVNPHSMEWGEIWQSMKAAGKYGLDADFQNFDANQHPDFMEAAGVVMIEVQRKWDLAHNDPKANENALVRAVLFDELITTPMVTRTSVFLSHKGNPSGNPITTVLNCFVNLLYHWYCTFRISGYISLVKFMDMMYFICFGDDVVFVPRKDYGKILNLPSFQKEMATLGQVYTAGDKTSSYVLKPIEEITFLQRSFYELDGFVLGPLRKDSIEQQFNWTLIQKNDVPTMQTQIHEALLEASNHGHAYYDSVLKALTRRILSLNADSILMSCLLPFRDARREMMQRMGLFAKG
jgi:hypothetical protein